MKKIIFALLFAAGAGSAMAADVGVSVTIGDPNFYGRVDIGNYPQPALIYRQPVVIAPPVVRYVGPPLYLRVPPGHYKNWSKYCGRYDACGHPVYFVQDNWYRNVYVPRYHEHDRAYERHDGEHDRGHGNDDRRHDERRYDDRR